MFEVRVFVDDKKLPQFLWALDGKIVGPPQIIPVRGAKARGGRVVSSSPNGATLPERVLAGLIAAVKNGGGPINRALIKDQIKAAGGSEGSYGSVQNVMRKSKALILVKGTKGTSTKYRINPKLLK